MPTGGVDYNTRKKEQLIELIEMIQRDRYRIEEEIGKIREVNRENCSLLDEFSEKIRELREENRKLKGKIRFLEQCLDNKEKVNKSLREENKRLEKEIAEYLDAIRNINH